MKTKLLIVTLVITILLSLPPSHADNCRDEIRTVFAKVGKDNPLEFEIPNYCESGKSCHFHKFQIATDGENTVRVLRTVCQEERNHITCSDYSEAFSTSGKEVETKTEESIQLLVVNDSPDDPMSKISYLFTAENLAISDKSTLFFESTFEPIPCYSFEPTIHRKTEANHVRDELNPYPGDHPDAIMELQKTNINE